MGKKKPKKKSAKKRGKKKPAQKRSVKQIAVHLAEKATKEQILL